jgi:hypothetical protein
MISAFKTSISGSEWMRDRLKHPFAVLDPRFENMAVSSKRSPAKLLALLAFANPLAEFRRQLLDRGLIWKRDI